eukprot:1443948-Pleurochrysis_carterae.AAC.8
MAVTKRGRGLQPELVKEGLRAAAAACRVCAGRSCEWLEARAAVAAVLGWLLRASDERCVRASSST